MEMLAKYLSPSLSTPWGRSFSTSALMTQEDIRICSSNVGSSFGGAQLSEQKVPH